MWAALACEDGRMCVTAVCGEFVIDDSDVCDCGGDDDGDAGDDADVRVRACVCIYRCVVVAMVVGVTWMGHRLDALCCGCCCN